MEKLKEFFIKQTKKLKQTFCNNHFFTKDFIREKQTVILIIAIALICSISISIGVYSQVANKKIINIKEKEEVSQQLKNNFNDIFNNKLNDYIYLAYDIENIKERKS